MRILKTVAAAALVAWLSSNTPMTAGASDEQYHVVILHGRVMDPESGLDAIRNARIKDGKIR